MTTTSESKKSVLPVDKLNEIQPPEEPNDSRHTANLVLGSTSRGEDLVDLSMILTEIRNFRQDVKA